MIREKKNLTYYRLELAYHWRNSFQNKFSSTFLCSNKFDSIPFISSPFPTQLGLFCFHFKWHRVEIQWLQNVNWTCEFPFFTLKELTSRVDLKALSHFMLIHSSILYVILFYCLQAFTTVCAVVVCLLPFHAKQDKNENEKSM